MPLDQFSSIIGLTDIQVMFLTIGAQVIETVLVRSVVLTAELGAKAVWWLGGTALSYVWPSEPTKEEEAITAASVRMLQEKVAELEKREKRLEELYGQREVSSYSLVD